MSLRLSLFGAPALQPADGPRRTLPWQRPTALLAMAACQPHGIGRDALATLLRPDADAASARAHLRRNLHRARALLPAPDALQADDQQVRWLAGCDVTEFLAACQARDWPRAVALQPAPLLDGCGAIGDAGIDRWLDTQRETLSARLRVALAACLDGETGDDGERAGWIERLLALDPFDEPAWQLALAAVRGPASRAAALDGVDRGIASAREQMGVDPLPATLALRSRVAQPGTAAPPSNASPPAAPAFEWLHGAVPLFGREALVDRVAAALLVPAQRWCTLYGVGGVGKTRLALAAAQAWAERCAGRVVAVDLGGFESGTDLAVAIAAAAGIAPQADDAARAVTEWLAQTLAAQPCLLLLDNFEPFAGDAAARAWPPRWLAGGDGARVLVTSREVLGDPAEHRLEVGGLDAVWACALVEHHARRLGVPLAAAESADVARIARRLEGHPLGLELAATWLPVMRPAEIASEIERGLAFLADDDDALPAAQRSLRAVFERSWTLLAPPLRDVLAALTVLHDGFDLEAARAIAGARPADLLRLAGQSLLRRGDDGRFDLHPLVHRFAALRLDAARREALAQRHAEHFASRLAALHDLGLGRASPSTVAWLFAERANLRAAWRHAAARRRVDLIAAMHRRLADVMSTRPWAREMAALWAPAAEAVPPDDPLHVALQVARAGALAWIGEVDAAAALVDAVQSRLHVAADRSAAATVRAIVARWRGDVAAQDASTREALDAARASGDPLLEARALQNRFVHEWSLGRGPAAEPLLLRMLALAEQHGANMMRARALRLLSTLRHDQGRDDEADALLAASSQAFAAVNDLSEVAFNERNAAHNARRRGDSASARRHASSSLATMQRLGLVEQAERSRLVLALVDADDGRLQEAERGFASALGVGLRLGHASLQVRAAVNLAATRLRRGDAAAAPLLARLLDAPGVPAEDRAQLAPVLAAGGAVDAAPGDLDELCAALLAGATVPAVPG